MDRNGNENATRQERNDCQPSNLNYTQRKASRDIKLTSWCVQKLEQKRERFVLDSGSLLSYHIVMFIHVDKMTIATKFTFAALVLCIFVDIVLTHNQLLEQLLRRIEALEKLNAIQKSRIDHQDKILQEYGIKMEHYENRFQDYSGRNEKVDGRASDTIRDNLDKNKDYHETDSRKEQHEPQSNDTDKMHVKLTDFARNVGVINQVKVPRLVLNSVEGPVAFHATNDKGITANIGQFQHILFEDVQLNLGNGFHSSHGLFIAPKAGIYIFSTSIMIQRQVGDIVASVKKNGADLAKAYANGNSGDPDQGSVTVVTQLNIGDEIWVSSIDRPTTSDFGDKLTSFTGYLLYEM